MSNPLFAIDAGHYIDTPGKRCLKSIDPGETREWVLNSRIADKVQERLQGYNCSTMRVDDVTGEREVTLSQRVALANQADADLYLSFHHNAGIHGGSGGGCVVYVAPVAQEQSVVVQKAIYESVVAATGLRGNRANPMARASLYVLRHTTMPAVLVEFGFMDSTTDTPIILTDEFAEQAAEGVVSALISLYDLKEEGDETVTYEQWKEYMDRYLTELAKQPADQWAVPHIESAIDAKAMTGVDGTIERPKSFVTRQELAVIAAALAK